MRKLINLNFFRYDVSLCRYLELTTLPEEGLLEVFLCFVELVFMAEHHDGIAWRYLCVTIHEDSLAVPSQTTNGDAKWQSKVFYRLSCHL